MDGVQTNMHVNVVLKKRVGVREGRMGVSICRAVALPLLLLGGGVSAVPAWSLHGTLWEGDPPMVVKTHGAHNI